MRGNANRVDVVTGAFGYIGRYIAGELLAAGGRVRTLTAQPVGRSPFGDRVEVRPYLFEDPVRLAESLKGARTVYNTYWIRFERGSMMFERAVANSQALIEAARHAGVERIVHVSITNPSADSDLAYFRGKALVEDAVRESGISYAILRPTVLFGGNDVLINNVAWILRRFPAFPLPGRGRYRVQPVAVEDFARHAVTAGGRNDDVTQDVVGPETHKFSDLVRLVRRAVGGIARIVPVPSSVALMLARPVGWLVRDVLLTADELRALQRELLVSSQPPVGKTRFSRWVYENASTVGASYASELDRHFRGKQPG